MAFEAAGEENVFTGSDFDIFKFLNFGILCVILIAKNHISQAYKQHFQITSQTLSNAVIPDFQSVSCSVMSPGMNLILVSIIPG
jgi:hypothetical protein